MVITNGITFLSYLTICGTLLNRVRNACEAVVTPGAKVTVSLKGLGSGVEVAISDEGTDIDPTTLGSLFQLGVSSRGERGNAVRVFGGRGRLQRKCCSRRRKRVLCIVMQLRYGG